LKKTLQTDENTEYNVAQNIKSCANSSSPYKNDNHCLSDCLLFNKLYKFGHNSWL